MLRILDERIAGRIAATTAAHPDWPCRRGCDLCCRSLSALPRVTAAEWDRMVAALGQLPAETAEAIIERLRTAEPGERICPFLQRDTGECSVYQSRPVGCRTYGFYADREGGLYCGEIHHKVESGSLPDVVWGNQEAVDKDLDTLGPRRSVQAWLSGAVC
jgi:Fe-S-cluster containining protein